MDCMGTGARAVFRLPAAAVLLPVLVVLCVTPLATAGGAWAALFALPLVVLAYILYTRTVADPQGVTVHTLLGRRTMAWADMAGLEFHGSRWAVAVGLDGRRLRLPMVRPRDLPRLTAVSGGSLTLGEAPLDTAEPPETALDAPAADGPPDTTGYLPAADPPPETARDVYATDELPETTLDSPGDRPRGAGPGPA